MGQAPRGGSGGGIPPEKSDLPFLLGLLVISAVYVFLIVAMLAADASFTTPGDLLMALDSQEIRYSIRLSLISCSLTTILSLWVAVPIGYLLSRYALWLRFLGAVDQKIPLQKVLGYFLT